MKRLLVLLWVVTWFSPAVAAPTLNMCVAAMTRDSLDLVTNVNMPMNTVRAWAEAFRRGMTGLPMIRDVRRQPWPAWYDAGFLFISGSPSLFAVGRPTSARQIVLAVSDFHPTRFGLLAVGRARNAWILQRKHPKGEER